MQNKKPIYQEVEASLDFATLETEILDYWQKYNIFQKSIDNRPALQRDDKGGASNEFIFYDGPPFANGLPHYGHLLTGFIKDVYARYQTMRGKRVERRFGWDCHGLPAEMGAEKDLGFSGRLAITEYGIDKFNDYCRTSVMKYANEWEKYVTRQARWVDFAGSYKTMDMSFMESVLWAFKELYNKGLIYESMKVMPYSWACETPLSNFETRLDNSYRPKVDKAITVSFILNSNNLPPELVNYKECRMLAWTTTPWTLPSNLALAVGSDIDYAVIEKGNVCYILAKSSLSKYNKELTITEETSFKTIKGEKLANLTYQPLFDYFEDHPNAFRVLLGDFVVEGEGTAIIHTAPGFGEDDHILCQANNIELVCPVDNAGKFTPEIHDLEGVHVFDANDTVIIKLKNQGNWLQTEQYTHNYPHCWRTDTPLIYKALPSWYVKVTDIKDKMIELNQQINWVPTHVRDNLFGKWLEGARDWSISRRRFWGTPIPVWRSDDPKYPRIDVYGSIAELEKDFGIKIEDLHRPFIDQLVRPNPDDPTGKSMMRRVEDVFDCWFESGSMPYGQAHYPFENKEWFEEHFPADFIVEYSAQTRGWFYTLMVLSTALFERPPFLNCICHGVILDSRGQKLSKRLNNYADPLELFSKYGSDALRVTMLSSTVVKGQELLIDKDGKMVYDTLRLFIKPIWHAYHFFTLYANADQIQATLDFSSNNVLDCYILSKLKVAVESIKHGLDNFDTIEPYNTIAAFFEVLNNWYIRRSRQRFWKSEHDNDKIAAYNTLYSCLYIITEAMAPLLPLVTEAVYKGLTVSKPEGRSVHLQNFPDVSMIEVNKELVEVMDFVLDVCNSALFIRNQQNIRVRQPLQSLTIVTDKTLNLNQFDELIKDEVNVKNIIYQNNIKDYADFKLVINFPIVGKRLPDKVKDIIAANKNNQWRLDEKNHSLDIANVKLFSEEFQINLLAKNPKNTKSLSDNKSLVALDLKITPELYEEGIARDLIRFVQQARKDAGFSISDYIEVHLSPDRYESIEQFNNVIVNYREFISQQVLATDIQIALKNEGTDVGMYTNNIEIFLQNQTQSLSICLMIKKVS